MDIIKTKNIKGKKIYSLSLIYFPDIKGYEVQFSEAKGDYIMRNDGIYSTKNSGLKAFDIMEEEVKKDIKKGDL